MVQLDSEVTGPEVSYVEIFFSVKSMNLFYLIALWTFRLSISS